MIHNLWVISYAFILSFALGGPPNSMSMSRDYRQMYNDEHFEPNPRDKEIVESELGQIPGNPQTEQPLARLISDQSAKSGKSETKTVKTEFAFFSSSDENPSDEDIDEGTLRFFYFCMFCMNFWVFNGLKRFMKSVQLLNRLVIYLM